MWFKLRIFLWLGLRPSFPFSLCFGKVFINGSGNPHPLAETRNDFVAALVFPLERAQLAVRKKLLGNRVVTEDVLHDQDLGVCVGFLDGLRFWDKWRYLRFS